MIENVLRNELYRSLKYKKKLILNFLLPIIAILIAVVVNYLIKPSINIGIINGNNVSESFIQDCEEFDGIKANNTNEKSIKADILLGKYDGIVDFNKSSKIKVISKDKDTSSLLKNSMNKYINDKSMNLFNEYLNKKGNSKISFESRTISFMFIIICIISSLLCNNLITDKDSGVLKRISITPNKYWKYLLGTYMYYYLFALLQCVLIITISTLIPVNLGFSISIMVKLLVTLPLITSSIGFILACICNNEIKSSTMASSITILLSLIGGAFLPLSKLPKVLLIISDFSVVNWIMHLNSIRNVMLIIILSLILIVISLFVGNNKFKIV